MLNIESHRSTTGFGCCDGRWWLHELGGQQWRGQLFGVMAIDRVLAALLTSSAALCIDEAERRFGDLVGRGQRVSSV